MCGIFACLYATQPCSFYQSSIDSIKHRGPDSSVIKQVDKHVLGFHRLAINDLSEKGNQPLTHPTLPHLTLICNGEIYNHAQLKQIYNFKTHSGSDCEIILHLYERFGIERTLKELDGYFAFVLVDGDTVIIARDEIGVRSLYFGHHKDGSIWVSSEMKAIYSHVSPSPFPPGTFWRNGSLSSYIEHKTMESDTYDMALKTTRDLLCEAVEKRVKNTERPIGCFLSVGLDSSLIAALVCRFSTQPVHTFSIGMIGSTDVEYARKVAEHLHTIHHEVIVTEQEMIQAIPEVIRQIETYDTTTVRASTPMYLLSRYVATQTDVRVIFSGEGSDELSGSYAYFKNAPNTNDFYEETLRLTQDLQYFDVLRCDKSTAGHGLEVRVPFLDKEFLSYYLHMNPEFKWYPSFGCEKYLLRYAFLDVLPHDVLWRKKEAFSDGVSSTTKSWYQIIQDHVSNLTLKDKEYRHNPPQMKETQWYRQLFEEFYPECEHLLPYYWVPRWCGAVVDPSARTLAVY